MADRLTREHWIRAGLEALESSGSDALKADSLSRILGVSRGSFYWHFQDVAAFHASVLGAWEETATGAVIQSVEAGGGSARDKLHRLSRIVFAENGALERQIRSWASHSPRAAEAQARVDRQRMVYVQSLIEQSAGDTGKADVLARFFYLAFVGQFATDRKYILDPVDLAMVVDRVIGLPASPR